MCFYAAEQVIIQVWISTHFGVISERLPITDENLLFIGGNFYPTAGLCKGNSSALWLAGVVRAAPRWQRAAQDRRKGATRVFQPFRLGRAGADFGGFPVRGVGKGQKGQEGAFSGVFGSGAQGVDPAHPVCPQSPARRPRWVDWKPSDLTCVQPGRQDRRTRKLRPARYSRRNLPVARCCPRGQSPLKRAQSQPLPVRAGPVAATPFTPIASQRGFRGPATRTSTIRPALRWRDHERASRNQHPATSNALPLRAVEYALAIRTFATQPARQAPLHPQPVTLAASARCTSNVPPLRAHERTPRNQRQ